MSEIHFYTKKKTFTNIFLIRFFTFLQISGMSKAVRVIFRVVLFIKKQNRAIVLSNGVAIHHDVV